MKSKNRKPLQTTLGKAPPMQKTPDLSHIRKPIETSIFGLRQVLSLFETSTAEVQNYITYECEVMFECRVCRTIFRSLANFILHKRNYCTDKYSHHGGPESHNESNCPLIIEDTPCVDGQSQSMAPESSKGDITPEKRLTPVIDKLIEKQKVKEIAKKALHEDLSKSNDNDTENRGMDNICLEKIGTSNSAVFQTMFKNLVEESKNSEFMKSEVMEIHSILDNDEAILGPDGKVCTFDVNKGKEKSNLPRNSLLCTECDLKFSTRKTLTYHIKYKHNDTRTVYPCPECKDTFANAWCVYRHLYKVHRKTSTQIRKLRVLISNSAIRKDQQPVRKRDKKQSPERTNDEKQWLKNVEGDNDLQMCGGCGKRFERKAALYSHSQMCVKRIAVCNTIKENSTKQKRDQEEKDKDKNAKHEKDVHNIKGSKKRKPTFLITYKPIDRTEKQSSKNIEETIDLTDESLNPESDTENMNSENLNNEPEEIATENKDITDNSGDKESTEVTERDSEQNESNSTGRRSTYEDDYLPDDLEGGEYPSLDVLDKESMMNIIGIPSVEYQKESELLGIPENSSESSKTVIFSQNEKDLIQLDATQQIEEEMQIQAKNIESDMEVDVDGKVSCQAKHQKEEIGSVDVDAVEQNVDIVAPAQNENLDRDLVQAKESIQPADEVMEREDPPEILNEPDKNEEILTQNELIEACGVQEIQTEHLRNETPQAEYEVSKIIEDQVVNQNEVTENDLSEKQDRALHVSGGMSTNKVLIHQVDIIKSNDPQQNINNTYDQENQALHVSEDMSTNIILIQHGDIIKNNDTQHDNSTDGQENQDKALHVSEDMSTNIVSIQQDDTVENNDTQCNVNSTDGQENQDEALYVSEDMSTNIVLIQQDDTEEINDTQCKINSTGGQENQDKVLHVSEDDTLENNDSQRKIDSTDDQEVVSGDSGHYSPLSLQEAVTPDEIITSTELVNESDQTENCDSNCCIVTRENDVQQNYLNSGSIDICSNIESEDLSSVNTNLCTDINIADTAYLNSEGSEEADTEINGCHDTVDISTNFDVCVDHNNEGSLGATELFRDFEGTSTSDEINITKTSIPSVVETSPEVIVINDDDSDTVQNDENIEYIMNSHSESDEFENDGKTSSEPEKVIPSSSATSKRKRTLSLDHLSEYKKKKMERIANENSPVADEHDVSFISKAAPYMNQRDLSCISCDVKFISLYQLLWHMSRHFSWFRFQCSRCPFMSFNKYECATHATRVHSIQQEFVESIVLPIPNWKTVLMSHEFCFINSITAMNIEELDASQVNATLSQQRLSQSGTETGDHSDTGLFYGYSNGATDELTTMISANDETFNSSLGFQSGNDHHTGKQEMFDGSFIEILSSSSSDNDTNIEVVDTIFKQPQISAVKTFDNAKSEDSQQKPISKVKPKKVTSQKNKVLVNNVVEKQSESGTSESTRPVRNRVKSVKTLQSDFLYDLHNVLKLNHSNTTKSVQNNKSKKGDVSKKSLNKNVTSKMLRVYSKPGLHLAKPKTDTTEKVYE